jgi:hypothetical protein
LKYPLNRILLLPILPLKAPAFAVIALVGLSLLVLALVIRQSPPTTQLEGNDPENRLGMIVNHRQMGQELSNFPVYLDLELLPGHFWESADPGCPGIRITPAAVQTALSYRIISCDVEHRTGALHFIAPFLSSTSDTPFTSTIGRAAQATTRSRT